MSVYQPFHFKVFVATSSNHMRQRIEALKKAAMEFSQKNEPLVFEVSSCYSLTTAFMPFNKQGFYDSIIAESHIVIALLEDGVGEFTMHEFWSAYELSLNRSGYPRCCVFASKQLKDSPDAMTALSEIKEKGQYWCWYSNEDELKYLFVQELEDQIISYRGILNDVMEDIAYDYSVTSNEQDNTCRFPDGATLQGAFENGYPSGMCTYTWTTGERTSGVFHFESEALHHGKSFTGFFCNHPPLGRGYLQEHNRHYLGEVIDEFLPHGYGRTSENSGKQVVAFWNHGRMEGKAKVHYPPDSSFEGFFHNGFPEGPGTYRFSTGMIADAGSWTYVREIRLDDKTYTGMAYLKKGKLGLTTKIYPCGQGSFYWPSNGDQYHGEVDDGLFHGYGKYIFNTKSTFSGYFKEGKIDSSAFGKFEFYGKNITIKGKWEFIEKLVVMFNDEQFYFDGIYCIAVLNEGYNQITGHGVICDFSGKPVDGGDFLNGVVVSR